MKYISTRGASPEANFDTVLRKALAPDGGLYLPKSWPGPRDWRAMKGASFPEIAAEVLHLFAGDEMSREEAGRLTEEAFATFRHPDVTPVVDLGGEKVMELFHGPTLAFKDVAMQLIARLFERSLEKSGGAMTVVVATSGDTGGAAVSALANREHLSICALHPHERISGVQRRFMTTSGAPNVLNLAVEGTFDDCQAIVKELFADRDFAAEVSLGGVNSINWARITAQVSYYIWACLAVEGDDIHFSVPTGNFGDVFAGWVAKKLGAPVGKLIIAVNENDILDRALRVGIYEKRGVLPTSSPSMDIEIASNFERAIFEASGRNAEMTADLMACLRETDRFRLSKELRAELAKDFVSYKAGEPEVRAVMAVFAAHYGTLLDPHTAIGIHGARRAREDALEGPIVTLATAHPAKFPEAVAAATGKTPDLPVSSEQLFSQDEVFSVVPSDTAAVKEALRGLK
ncbi:threonine synthase [Parvularcula lutaonensis]|uniref:Threonine synthase n=1 Tax=Parvularcula lutaonensis TaxID=491923 RepID=A0ABV7MHR0_9PROT|nr:threonine synthase [Parvularcula lutaonensis]GGY54913.1 threonine synthase [Parvularcula lutaonensis]